MFSDFRYCRIAWISYLNLFLMPHFSQFVRDKLMVDTFRRIRAISRGYAAHSVFFFARLVMLCTHPAYEWPRVANIA
eukprot:g59965.t1